MERPNASCLNMYVEVQNSPKIELLLDRIRICFAKSLIKYLNSIIAISERESVRHKSVPEKTKQV